VRGSGEKALLCDQRGELDEEIEKIYLLIGKAYKETDAAYLLIHFSYEQIGGDCEERSAADQQLVQFAVR
jgi:hypothetical protein